MLDVNILLDEAIKETEHLNDDEVFLVKDLYKGYYWNRIPRRTRLILGIFFLIIFRKQMALSSQLKRRLRTSRDIRKQSIHKVFRNKMKKFKAKAIEGIG